MTSTYQHGHKTFHYYSDYNAWPGHNTLNYYDQQYTTPLYRIDSWLCPHNYKKKKRANRDRIKRRRCNNKDNHDSTLKIFYANVTLLGKNAIAYLLNRPEHVLLTVETHLRDEPAHTLS